MSAPFDPSRMSDDELQAVLDSELVSHVRAAAKRVTGGNCMFADDDVNLLAELAALALDAGLHEGIITDKVTLFQVEQARADRAASGTLTEGGDVEQAPSDSLSGPTGNAGDAQ